VPKAARGRTLKPSAAADVAASSTLVTARAFLVLKIMVGGGVELEIRDNNKYWTQSQCEEMGTACATL
jgi:hypothetical protein